MMTRTSTCERPVRSVATRDRPDPGQLHGSQPSGSRERHRRRAFNVKIRGKAGWQGTEAEPSAAGSSIFKELRSPPEFPPQPKGA